MEQAWKETIFVFICTYNFKSGKCHIPSWFHLITTDKPLLHKQFGAQECP